MHKTPRRQKPVKGGRQQVGAGVIKDIEIAIEHDMARFNVSRSFVIAVALADHYGIDEQEDFYPKRLRRVV